MLAFRFSSLRLTLIWWGSVLISALYFVIYTGFAHLDRGQEPFDGLFFVMGVLFFLRLVARNIWWASLTPFIAFTLVFIFLQVETPFSPDSIQAFLTWVLSMAFLYLCLKKVDKTPLTQAIRPYRIALVGAGIFYVGYVLSRANIMTDLRPLHVCISAGMGLFVWNMANLSRHQGISERVHRLLMRIFGGVLAFIALFAWNSPFLPFILLCLACALRLAIAKGWGAARSK